MHWHADWAGMGNLSRRDRTAGWPRPHQCWLLIDARDSSQDAVFLHTPNPNADNFPCVFAGTAWDAPVPELLREFVADFAWQFGRAEERGTHFVVRLRPGA
jgi:hypothetical protein